MMVGIKYNQASAPRSRRRRRRLHQVWYINVAVIVSYIVAINLDNYVDGAGVRV